MANEAPKKVFTKEDQLSASKAAKKYNLDKAKAEILMRIMYSRRTTIPGAPLKQVITGKIGKLRLNPDPRAHEYFLMRYEQEFNPGH